MAGTWFLSLLCAALAGSAARADTIPLVLWHGMGEEEEEEEEREEEEEEEREDREEEEREEEEEEVEEVWVC